jgi:hypothetical protein
VTWERYTQRDNLIQEIDYVGGSVAIYIGESVKGASIFDTVWRIKKFTYDANNNVLSEQFSPAFSTFGDIWNNRASLTYT